MSHEKYFMDKFLDKFKKYEKRTFELGKWPSREEKNEYAKRIREGQVSLNSHYETYITKGSYPQYPIIGRELLRNFNNLIASFVERYLT